MTMHPKQVPEALLRQVIDYFDPLRVILFGSHARGEAGPDSDWDLLVILDDGVPPELLTQRAGFEARRRWEEPADIVPVRESRFRSRALIPGTLSRSAAEEGVIVYERA